jgi:hypothetical protein
MDGFKQKKYYGTGMDMAYAGWKRDFGSYLQETCKANALSAGCFIRSSVDIISKIIRIILIGLKEGWFSMYIANYAQIKLRFTSFQFNLLKPTGYGIHQQVEHFNNCTLCPYCLYVFCIYLRTNRNLCHLHKKLIGFYNRDEKCLQRGTDWAFK